MTNAKRFKLMQAQQAFARQVEYVRAELLVCTRTGHLEPVLDFLEWLVRDMAELAGVTAEVQAYAKEHAAVRSQVHRRTLDLFTASRVKRTPTRPQLRLVK